MKIKNLITVLLTVFLCVGCASYRVNLADLNNEHGRYGLVVFRTMFFDREALAYNFCDQGDSNIDLTYSNRLYVVASKSPGSNFRPRDYINSAQGNYVTWKELDEKLFIKKPMERISLFETKPEILKPEYFYMVAVLSEGKYYVDSIENGLPGKPLYYLKKEFRSNEERYYFYVKAGHVNYLGDFYSFAPARTPQANLLTAIFTKDKYSQSFMVCSRSQDARVFIKKFYPEVKLPFTKNLMSCCKRLGE